MHFHLEMIKIHRSLQKKCIGKFHVPFPQPPPMLTSYTTIIHDQNPRKMTLAQSIELIQISTVIHALICVCVEGVRELYEILSHVLPCVTTTTIEIFNCVITTRLPHVTPS